jgi:hypothetical protein
MDLHILADKKYKRDFQPEGRQKRHFLYPRYSVRQRPAANACTQGHGGGL